MANWAWPHTPASNLARMILRGGPFDGEAGVFVPADTSAPIQLVWSGWLPGAGFTAWLYEWRGETEMDHGRTDALIYRPTGRRLSPDEIPPLVADTAELYADTTIRIIDAHGVPPEVIH